MYVIEWHSLDVYLVYFVWVKNVMIKMFEIGICIKKLSVVVHSKNEGDIIPQNTNGLTGFLFFSQ